MLEFTPKIAHHLHMSIPSPSVLGRMIRPMTQKLSPEALREIASYQAGESEENRYHDLADRNAEGTITDDERSELESIVAANTLLSILRKEARAILQAA
jgi:hypothetical protein